MGALIPTAVTIQDLATTTSAINVINPAVAQAVSPRKTPLDHVTVQVKDDPLVPAFFSGTCTANVLNTVTDAGEDFTAAGVQIGWTVWNSVTFESAVITAVGTDTLTCDSDVCPVGNETFEIKKPSFWTQKNLLGEWIQSGITNPAKDVVSYDLPTAGTAAAFNMYSVVHPQATPENTGGYTVDGTGAV